MSHVYYHRGLTIEIDLSIPKVSIEGCEIPKKEYGKIFDPSEISTHNVEKLGEHAREFIENSQGFQKREECRREHLAILNKGVSNWSEWRKNNPEIRPLLYDSDLSWHNFPEPLDGVNFANAVLINSNLCHQKLSNANFHEANLGRARLHNANLTEANFCRTDLYETELQYAILNKANFQGAQLAKTNFENAQLNDCKVYGASAWDLKLDEAEQNRIIIRYLQENMEQEGEGKKDSEITVDSLEDAQLVFLLLNNPKIHGVLESVTSKVVLILGRFTDERKRVLDALRKSLRNRNFVPIIFDFEKPERRDLTETISMLAHMALFVIADITDEKSIPQELQKIVPNLPSLPVRSIIQEDQYEYAMFEGFGGYLSVLPPYRYQNTEQLLESLEEHVIKPSMDKADEIYKRRKAFEKKLKS